jgi:hypothetical protein
MGVSEQPVYGFSIEDSSSVAKVRIFILLEQESE